MIAQIIIKYWVELLLGLVASGLGFLAKRFYTLYEKEKKHQKTEEQEQFYQGLKDLIKEGNDAALVREKKLSDEIVETNKRMDTVISGVLSLQGRIFKDECRGALEPTHMMTVSEYEALQAEYDIYKELGGNHVGDLLFELIKEKATNTLTDDK